MDAWIIVDRPEETIDPRDPGADGEGWRWTIRRGDKDQTVTVLLSGTAMQAMGHVSADLEDARRTQGRNYIESILDRDDPPSRYLTANTTHTLPGNLIEGQ